MKATIVIPVRSHLTVSYSVRSALAQDETAIEVFAIGTGATPQCRKVIEDLRSEDPRLLFFDNPQGSDPRTSIHASLVYAAGRVVCYLEDGDLMLPGHVSTMAEPLRHADIATSMQVHVDGEDRLATGALDLGMTYYRRQVLSGKADAHLSTVAHDLVSYRRLVRGWAHLEGKTTILRLFLQQQGCRSLSTNVPTTISIRSAEARGGATAKWAAIAADPEELHVRLVALHEQLKRERAHAEAELAESTGA